MNLYKNYYKNHEYSQHKINYKGSYMYHNKNFGNEIKKYNKTNSLILEIGSGQGTFAYYCKKLGFKNYVGFDLDSVVLEQTKQKYTDYLFFDGDIFNYLQKNIKKYDIVFMSHVFEHLSLEEGKKISSLIYKSLKKGGVWLNSMPNASAPYQSGYTRYNDITHKIIYTDNSFNQLLISSGFNRDSIIHKNEYIGYNVIKRLIFIIGVFINKILWTSVGYLPKIYTSSIISIIKK